jgi:hypothetical protein
MTETVHIFQHKAWYFLSIYYSRDKWQELISRIMLFQDTYREQFGDCLVFLSEERGEHIRVAFISPDCVGNYRHEISVFFQSYLDTRPSFSTQPVPYGRVLWCNYPNNTLVWDRFSIWDHSERYIRFHRKTFRLALQLLENDFSDDNLLSCALYLAVKGLACFDPDKQNKVFSDTLNEVLENMDDSIVSILQSIIEQTDEQEVYETIETYRREDASEYSPELIEWLNEIENMKEETEFSFFCFMIGNILGLTGFHQVLVLMLLNIRQKTFSTQE